MAYDFPDDINFLDSTDVLILESISDTIRGIKHSTSGRKKKKRLSEKIYDKYGVTRDNPDYDGYELSETSINAFFD